MALRYRTEKKYRNNYTYRGFNITWGRQNPTAASFAKQSAASSSWGRQNPTAASFAKQSAASSSWTKEDKPGGA